MFLSTSKYKRIVKLLKLKKPLIIFYATTTGPVISSDKIIHLAYIKIWPDGRTKKGDMKFNPEFKLQPESIAMHGIRNRDLSDKPTFREEAQYIWDEFTDCYYSGFNVKNFDLPILRREFVRVGMDFEYDDNRIIDTKVIFNYLAPRNLPLAWEYYMGKEHTADYNAMTHTEMITEILSKQLEKYNETQNLEFLNMIHETESKEQGATRKFYWVDGEAYFAFSKYKDRRVSSIAKRDPAFLEWILEADFRDDAKNIVRQALDDAKGK